MRDRHGFTLIELLVALVISGLLVGVIFQLLQGNSRFVRLQSAQEEVQQNGRAALDLIASELRGVPRGGILVMDEHAIEFRLPRAWGVLCNALDPSTGTAWVLFPAGTFPADFELSSPEWGIAVEQTADPSQGTGIWRFVAGVTTPGTADPCDGLAAQGANERVGFSSNGTSFVAAGMVQPGTPVLVFQRMRYEVEESAPGATVPGFWIRRSTGWNPGASNLNMQPMAGPVSGLEGLTFTYLQEDGVTEALSSADVRLVRVRVITQSRSQGERNGVRVPEQIDTTSTDVFLRN